MEASVKERLKKEIEEQIKNARERLGEAELQVYRASKDIVKLEEQLVCDHDFEMTGSCIFETHQCKKCGYVDLV